MSENKNKKIIKISSDFFSEKTKTQKFKKTKINTSLLINPNILKKNLLNRIKAFKNKEDQHNKSKIISIPGLSWRERQKEFKKLKPPCINCKRPVGSKFSSYVDEEKIDRHLIALCGSKETPCELNIDINLSNVFNLNEEKLINESELIDYKNSIINDKNNLIFDEEYLQ